MSRSHAWITFFIACLACTPEEKRVPSDILPVDTMKTLVWNMTEAGEYALYQKEKDSALKSLNTAYFIEVLKMHHLDKTTFIKSFDYYQSHPYLNKILFDSITAYAARKRTGIYKKIE
jgi:hypothetical protein